MTGPLCDIKSIAFLAALCIGSVNAAPKPVRDSAYDWRCEREDGAVVSNHQQQHNAVDACQAEWEKDPSRKYFVRGGVYRIAGSPPVVPAPAPPPPFSLVRAEGRIEIDMTGPPITNQTEVLVSTGDWQSDQFFGVWTWNGQIHARLGGDTAQVFRPSGSHLVPGQKHKVTVSWSESSGFTVLVDGLLTIRAPDHKVSTAGWEDAFQIQKATIPWGFAPVDPVCVTAYGEPVAPMSCPTPNGTLNLGQIDCE